MNAVRPVAADILSLRLAHCRAEQAAAARQFHVAVMHYRSCLEAAEQREDGRASLFFASRLAECYEQMGLHAKAEAFLAFAAPVDDLDPDFWS